VLKFSIGYDDYNSSEYYSYLSHDREIDNVVKGTGLAIIVAAGNNANGNWYENISSPGKA